MKGLIICLLSIVLLGSLLIQTFVVGEENSIWIGDSIIVYVRAPVEVKSGDRMQIEIEIRIVHSIQIERFVIEVRQGYDALYSKTLWQNQKLMEGFKYSETILVSTRKREGDRAEALWLMIAGKYDSIYHDIYPSLRIATIRDLPYDELKSKYESLKADYSTISSQYAVSQNLLNEAYGKISSLEVEKNALMGGVVLSCVIILIEAGVILLLLFRRRKNSASATTLKLFLPSFFFFKQERFNTILI
ncbi:MAG: hypothetical protein QXO47_09020 [Thermoproteota archaeon]